MKLERQNQWDIERLKEKTEEFAEKLDKIEQRIHDLEIFKETTVQQLIVVFDKLKELQEGDKFIKRMFITALVGSAFSAVAGLIVWAIQN